jgi:diguanylate cyclase (GGDEF)-like protein
LLAALVQDIGALLLMQHHSARYLPITEQAGGDNQRLLALEKEHLGADHASIGAELAHQWDLPGYLVNAIAHSETAPTDKGDLLQQCVYASGPLADIWLGTTPELAHQHALQILAANLGLDSEAVASIIARTSALLPEAATAFDTTLYTPEYIQDLLEQAREISQLRELLAAQEAEVLRERSDTLERHAIELSSMANRDALTGAINRGHFEKTLGAAFEQATQQRRPLAVAFIDLDDFKKINDRHGHLVGDEALKAVAHHLKDSVRSVDTVARFGGEEFVIIFPDTPLAGARTTIERVLISLSAHPVTRVDGQPLHVTFSAGIACHLPEQPFASAHALLDAADRALYQSKGEGRNRVASHHWPASIDTAG